MSDVRNVIIVGSGPAGLTAAIYAGRANLSPLIVAGSQPGGQLTLTSEVENYPGFVEAILGPELMDVMRKQAERFGTEFIDDDVVGVDLSTRPFTVKTAERTWRCARARRRHRRLRPAPRPRVRAAPPGARLVDLRDVRRLLLQGPGAGRRRAAATPRMEEATLPDEVRQQGDDRPPAGHAPGVQDHAGPGAPEPEDRVGAEPRGRGDPRHRPGHRRPAPRPGRARKTEEIQAGGVFVAIGHTPNTQLFAGQLEMDPAGYLVTQPGSTRTNVPGSLRGRRRGRPRLPPGGDGRGHGLHGRDRRRALPRGRAPPLTLPASS